jgi:outer membrane protein
MLKRTLGIVLGAAMGAVLPAAGAEDLMQIYHDAVANDPTLASARATWLATQENVPQARANLLPSVTLAANANYTDFRERLHTDPSLSFTQN